MNEACIPNARDAVIARFGRDSHGYYRCYCNNCNDSAPLADSSPVYGDLYTGGTGESCEAEACGVCDATLLDLSRRCQLDHDEQQRRFARQRFDVVIEYGLSSAVRCRVY